MEEVCSPINVRVEGDRLLIERKSLLSQKEVSQTIGRRLLIFYRDTIGRCLGSESERYWPTCLEIVPHRCPTEVNQEDNGLEGSDI